MSYETLEVCEPLRVRVTVGATCDSCHTKLEPVHVDEKGRWDAGAKGSLELILSGGYAQFFDDQSVRVLLCSECAKKLLDQNPHFNEQMERQGTF